MILRAYHAIAFIAAVAAAVAAIAATPPARVIVETDDGGRFVYVPESAPEPPPIVLPANPFTRLVAPSTGPRGNGIRLSKAKPTLARSVVAGFEQNVIAENIAAPVLIEDCRIANSYRATADDRFVGQSIYLENIPSAVIRGVFFRYAGWQPGRPDSDRNGHRHHVYSNFGVKSLLIEDCWLDEAAACAIQHRGGPAIVRRCLITRAAIGVLAVMGPVTLEDVTIYDGTFYHQPTEGGKPALTANVAIMALWPVECLNVWIVGHPDQAKPDFGAGLKSFALGAVVCSGSYAKSEWRKPAVKDLITARGDCRIIGWPGPAFAGDRKDDGAGWTVAGRAVDVRAELDQLRRQLDTDASPRAVATIVEKGQAIVRAAAAATLPRP